MLKQFGLSTSEAQTAIKLFGPPKNDPIVKFTGGQPQLYQRCRIEFMTSISAASAESVVDWRYAEIEYDQRAQQAIEDHQALVDALVPWQPPGVLHPPPQILPPVPPQFPPFVYGDNGENIVEATTRTPLPNRNVMVVAKRAEMRDRELQRHHVIQQAIDALPPAARNVETVREATRHGTEMDKLEGITLDTLEGSYHRRMSEYNDAIEELKSEQKAVAEAFFRHFAGSALTNIRELLNQKAYRRALWTLDRAHGLRVNNDSAAITLSNTLRQFTFSDDLNFQSQLDEFMRIAEMLVLVGHPIPDDQKRMILMNAILSGGSVIRKVYQSLLHTYSNTILFPEPPEFQDFLTQIKRHYSNISAEISTMVNPKPESSEEGKVRGKKRAYANVAEPEESPKRGSSWSNVAEEQSHSSLLAGSSSAISLKCTKCGKGGHTVNECWSDMTCTKCGKKGHPASSCLSFTKCSKCGKTGHLASRCRAKGKQSKKNSKKNSGGGGGAGLLAQVKSNTANPFN
jgi:hypothetical protein